MKEKILVHKSCGREAIKVAQSAVYRCQYCNVEMPLNDVRPARDGEPLPLRELFAQDIIGGGD